MRIFTLGKNGIPVFLFAFILFSGTYSSYGQTNCPEIVDQDTSEAGNQQFFCNSEQAEIGDLAATGNVAWYADQTSTTPLSSTELLTNGGVYYAGNPDDASCPREAVTVTVYTEPDILGLKLSATKAPSSLNKQSLSVIGVCVADIENPDVTVGDIRTSADEDPTLTVNWYYNRTDTTPIDPNTPLQDNTDYFASATSSITGCETTRRKTTVQLNSEPAPTGPQLQEFCAASNPTLADIVASGENRYFDSPTSVTELSANTPLIDGATYYITALGAECESTERLAVTVNLQEVSAGQPASVELCLSDAQGQFATAEDAQAFYLSLLEPGVDTEGTFEPTMEVLVADFNDNPFATFTTNYTVTNEMGCPGTTELSVTVLEDPDAGAPNSLELCLSEAELRLTSVEDMRTLFLELLATGTDNTGSYAPSIEDLYADYQAAPVGTFETTYTVTSADCEDSAVFALNVVPDPVAGDDTELDLCQSEVEAYFANPEDLDATFTALIPNADPGGIFSPSLEDIATQYFQDAENGNFPGLYNTTYTVIRGQNCTDSAEISIIVREDPYAGEGNSITYCSNDLPATQTEGEVEQLYLDMLTTGVSTTGTFEPTIADITSNYNANPIGTFTTVYTVSNEQCEDSVELSFTVEEALPADAGGPTTVTFCRVDGAQDLMEFLDPATNPNGYFEEAEASAFIPSEAGVGTYTFTYTVDESSDCVTGTDSAVYTVEVTDTPVPTYVADQNVFCSYEGATLTTLEAAIAEAGEVTWYTSATGAETYDADHILEDGVTYYAAITPDSECESFERLAVTPTIEVCESLIPEAFSPNGDGINDRFEITNLEQYPNYTIEVFNRYGNTVFKGNASSPSWDGTSSEGSLGDKVLPVGVYFYILNYNDGQTPPTQGRLYLSR